MMTGEATGLPSAMSAHNAHSWSDLASQPQVHVPHPPLRHEFHGQQMAVSSGYSYDAYDSQWVAQPAGSAAAQATQPIAALPAPGAGNPQALANRFVLQVPAPDATPHGAVMMPQHHHQHEHYQQYQQPQIPRFSPPHPGEVMNDSAMVHHLQQPLHYPTSHAPMVVSHPTRVLGGKREHEQEEYVYVPASWVAKPRNQSAPADGAAITSKFHGVTWYKATRRWQARLCVGSKQVHLGYFKVEEEAARAYDMAVLQARPAHAQLNFPDEVHQSASMAAAFAADPARKARRSYRPSMNKSGQLPALPQAVDQPMDESKASPGLQQDENPEGKTDVVTTTSQENEQPGSARSRQNAVEEEQQPKQLHSGSSGESEQLPLLPADAAQGPLATKPTLSPSSVQSQEQTTRPLTNGGYAAPSSFTHPVYAAPPRPLTQAQMLYGEANSLKGSPAHYTLDYATHAAPHPAARPQPYSRMLSVPAPYTDDQAPLRFPQRAPGPLYTGPDGVPMMRIPAPAPKLMRAQPYEQDMQMMAPIAPMGEEESIPTMAAHELMSRAGKTAMPGVFLPETGEFIPTGTTGTLQIYEHVRDGSQMVLRKVVLGVASHA